MMTPAPEKESQEQMRLLNLPYRAAIIGCGRMAHGHAHAYQRLDQTQLACCADVDASALDAFRRRYHVPFGYTDYREMLDKERPDLVSIVTWPGLHAEMVIAAAQAGVRGILCEKPLGLTLEEIDAMLQACREHGAVLIVNHQRRWLPLYETARALIADGAIGQPVEMASTMAGSDLLTDGTHAIDLFRFYAQDRPIDWVYAQVTYNGRSRYGHPVEDTGWVTFRFEDGVWATLRTGRLPAPSFEAGEPFGPTMIYCAARIVGTQGVLEVSGDTREPRLYLMRSGDVGWKTIEPNGPHPPPAMVRSLEALVQALDAGTDGADHRNHALHGRTAVEVVIAAFLSAAKRRPIRLPLDPLGRSLEALLEALRGADAPYQEFPPPSEPQESNE